MSINEFLATMNANGGMSISNSFVVDIIEDEPEGSGLAAENNIFQFLCDEAQLPDIGTGTGTIEGRYVGEGQVNYPHTRIFTEVSLGFQCDANMTPLKYLNRWHNDIFGEPNLDEVEEFENRRISPPNANRTNKLRLPQSYCRTVRITKTEIGPPSAPLRPSVTYLLERAWPFAIDAVPLQFGSNILTKVTCQLYYTRHTVVGNDIALLPFNKKEKTEKKVVEEKTTKVEKTRSRFLLHKEF